MNNQLPRVMSRISCYAACRLPFVQQSVTSRTPGHHSIGLGLPAERLSSSLGHPHLARHCDYALVFAMRISRLRAAATRWATPSISRSVCMPVASACILQRCRHKPQSCTAFPCSAPLQLWPAAQHLRSERGNTATVFEVWAHGLGGSCEADDARGVEEILDPGKLGNRTVLRLDLRGHGRSAGAHDPGRRQQQYTWPELAKDLRRAAADSVSRCFYGGEALGAAVALHAAVAATATGSVDAPPGLVLMRPPLALAQVARGEADSAWQEQLLRQAATLEAEGFEGLEALEATQSGRPLLNGAAAFFADPNVEQLCTLRRTMSKASFAKSSQRPWISDSAQDALAAAVRGHAESQQPDLQLISRLKETVSMPHFDRMQSICECKRRTWQKRLQPWQPMPMACRSLASAARIRNVSNPNSHLAKVDSRLPCASAGCGCR